MVLDHYVSVNAVDSHAIQSHLMRIARFASAVLAILIILFLGCQHAAIAYRLRRDGLDAVLLPPTTSNNASQTLSVAIKHARRSIPKMGDCDITGDLISLRWESSTANISFHPQSFFAPADESHGPGMYVDPLLAINTFRTELIESQSRGCLSATENERLRRAIVENLPLPPVAAYFVQLGSYDITGYFDLTPDFRMQITSPVYSPDAQPAASSLIGYETANYTFVREGSENRTRLRLASATEVPIAGAPFAEQSLHSELRFSKSAVYFRLVFMAEESAPHRFTRAIVLSARDQTKLNQAMAHRGTSADKFCATVSSVSVSCTVIPKNFGVSPELRVRVNHKDAFVPVGGMVQEAINLPNDTDPPRSLQVLRPFHGRLIPIQFDPSSRDILKLVLLPGDQITF